MTSFEIVPFQNDKLEALREGDTVWVSLRRMCEGIGVDLSRQLKKIHTKPWAEGRMALKAMHDSSGRAQSVACIDLDVVPMWLATLELSRVSEAARPKLRGYQVECARVLQEHFFGPKMMPSGGSGGSGGMVASGGEGKGLIGRAYRELANLADRTEELEDRMARVEARPLMLPAPGPSIDIVEALRKAFHTDEVDNNRRRGPDPGGARMIAASRRLVRALGKHRENWLLRDYLIGCEIAERELGYTMSCTRAIMPPVVA